MVTATQESSRFQYDWRVRQAARSLRASAALTSRRSVKLKGQRVHDRSRTDSLLRGHFALGHCVYAHHHRADRHIGGLGAVWGRLMKIVLIAALGLVSACALPVRQLELEQPLVLASGRSFVLADDVHCSIGTGYGRILRRGTRWEQFGTIGQSAVYRSPDQVLTVEGYNVHEAYLVVNEDWLTGFYLPVEKKFTPASKRVRLSTIEP